MAAHGQHTDAGFRPPGARTPSADSEWRLRNPEQPVGLQSSLQPAACPHRDHQAALVRTTDVWAPRATKSELLQAGWVSWKITF